MPFSLPHKFPITDSLTRIALSKLFNKKKSFYNNNYTQFVRDINDLKKDLPFEITYAEIDAYLWLYGQWLNYIDKNQGSLEFLYLVKHHYKSLEQLSTLIE